MIKRKGLTLILFLLIFLVLIIFLLEGIIIYKINNKTTVIKTTILNAAIIKTASNNYDSIINQGISGVNEIIVKTNSISNTNQLISATDNTSNGSIGIQPIPPIGNISNGSVGINVAYGKNYSKSCAPSASYPDIGNNMLTNGIYGNKAEWYDGNWVGWDSCNPEIIINLTKNEIIGNISVSFMEANLAGIYLPSYVGAYWSNNSVDWNDIGELKNISQNFNISNLNIKASYIKISVTRNSYGWLFMDEITIFNATERKKSPMNITLQLNNREENLSVSKGEIVNITFKTNVQDSIKNITMNFLNSSNQTLIYSTYYTYNVPAFYSHLVANSFGNEQDSMKTKDLETIAEWLYTNGYRTLTYSQLAEKIKNNEFPLVEPPYKPILISFDESYETHYTNVYRILKKYNFTATIAIQTDAINTKGNLNISELLEMQNYGFEIASHSKNHPNLLLNSTVWGDQINGSKNIMESWGLHVKTFVYPFGARNASTDAFVKSCGYTSARGVSGNSIGDGGASAFNEDWNWKQGTALYSSQRGDTPQKLFDLLNYLNEHIEVADVFSVNADVGTTGPVARDTAYVNDTYASLALQDTGDSANIPFYINQEGNYTLTFRVSTGFHSDHQASESRYEYVINGITYNDSNWNLKTTGPYVDDDATLWVSWGNQYMENVHLNKGWNNITINDLSDTILVNSLEIKKLGDLELSINTTNLNLGSHKIIANVMGNDYYLNNSKQLNLQVL